MVAKVLTLRRQTLGTVLVLLLPALVIYTLFVVYPVLQAMVYSLYRWNGFGPLNDFRGLENFARLFGNAVFLGAIRNSFLIMIFSLMVQLPLAMVLALIVHKSDFPLAVLFRTVFFLPFVMSEIVTGVLWQFIYHPQYGLVNYVIQLFNPGAERVALLANPDTVLGAILIVILWKYFGLHMTIYIAGLQGIPNELYDAARIDGAGDVQVIRRIVLPLLRPTIMISVFFSIIGSLQVFDIIWAMGRGGPVNASETMVTFMYKFGLERYAIGYGSAVAVTIFLICLSFSVIYQRFLVRTVG
ncbi:sugar ABC transporter permease [Alkalispirochaeta sphaeroplastigenens]|uniref:Sugar ABC transporter permease n=1 Tax=Alkalispirochaeta sphaeroplastigenens TaxID=1187066 RepID=A0A2S4JLE0_9SPIO|nr:sugar ABC transporter permease [Alkalispirochaeta sphaeroplastigenens]POR00339.1 sugar ABC transporter permease [Alkalispirochaeta sphaeroplastigenens]